MYTLVSLNILELFLNLWSYLDNQAIVTILEVYLSILIPVSIFYFKWLKIPNGIKLTGQASATPQKGRWKNKLILCLPISNGIAVFATLGATVFDIYLLNISQSYLVALTGIITITTLLVVYTLNMNKSEGQGWYEPVTAEDGIRNRQMAEFIYFLERHTEISKTYRKHIEKRISILHSEMKKECKEDIKRYDANINDINGFIASKKSLDVSFEGKVGPFGLKVDRNKR